MALVEKYIDETWFTWFGAFSDSDPYYYRIQSPVAFVEVRRSRTARAILTLPRSLISMPAVRSLSSCPDAGSAARSLPH
jgi:hypothetical protein